MERWKLEGAAAGEEAELAVVSWTAPEKIIKSQLKGIETCRCCHLVVAGRGGQLWDLAASSGENPEMSSKKNNNLMLPSVSVASGDGAAWWRRAGVSDQAKASSEAMKTPAISQC